MPANISRRLRVTRNQISCLARTARSSCQGKGITSDCTIKCATRLGEPHDGCVTNTNYCSSIDRTGCEIAAIEYGSVTDLLIASTGYTGHEPSTHEGPANQPYLVGWIALTFGLARDFRLASSAQFVALRNRLSEFAPAPIFVRILFRPGTLVETHHLIATPEAVALRLRDHLKFAAARRTAT